MMTEAQRLLREAWFGILQEHLERFIENAPDDACRELARSLWDQTAAFTDDD